MFDLSNCRFAFVDLETTGLSPWFGDRVCEVGIVLTEGKRIKSTYQKTVNPERPLSPAAASTNRLDDGELRSAPAFAEVAEEVEGWLAEAVVVSHNAQFDLQFLDSEFRRLGREIEIPNLIDTLGVAQQLVECPSYSLVSLAEAFQVQKVEAHRALADALINRAVFFALMDVAAAAGKSLQEFIGIYNSPAWSNDNIQLPVELAEAVQGGRQLTITYVDGRGERTRRRVDPVQVVGLADYIYLRGYCHLRKAERSFRLDRIVELRVRD